MNGSSIFSILDNFPDVTRPFPNNSEDFEEDED